MDKENRPNLTSAIWAMLWGTIAVSVSIDSGKTVLNYIKGVLAKD